MVIVSVREQLEQLINTFTQQLEAMEQEIKSLVEADHAWSVTIKLLQTIPGIGLLTSCWLVVATLNFTTCKNVESLVSYIGLAPMERSSGTSIRGRPAIGHTGQARLRTLLYLATLSAARYNPVIKALWYRLREKKHKPFKVARCACTRKLVHLAFAIVRSGKSFDPRRVVGAPTWNWPN